MPTDNKRRRSRSRGPLPSDILVVPTLDGIKLDILDDIVGYRLRRAQVVIYQDYVQAIGTLDIRPAQFAAMVIIGSNPGLSQTTLATTMGIDRSGAVILIDALEARGLAKRSPSPVDRRTHAITLTDHGQDVLAQLKSRVRDHELRITSAMSDDERRTLIELLQRIYAPPAA